MTKEKFKEINPSLLSEEAQQRKDLRYATVEDALLLASQYGLEDEVQNSINQGLTPYEAILEWDL